MEKKREVRPSRLMASSPAAAADVKLAAVALALNVRLRSADMPAAMQERAFRSARALLDEADSTSRLNPTCIAKALKKAGVANDDDREDRLDGRTRLRVCHTRSIAIDRVDPMLTEFDASYGPAWHCVVGKSFGSFMTHSPGGFLYFSLDRLSFLLFKTQVTPVDCPTSDP